MNRITAIVYILLVFFVTFLVTTIIADTICRANGYYDEGINDAKEVGL